MERGITPIVRQVSDNVNLYTGREGIETAIPSSINPVTEIQKNGKYFTIFHDVNITGTGNKQLHQVPDNEFWTIHFITVALAGGVWTCNALVFILPEQLNYDTLGSFDPDQWDGGQIKPFYPSYDSTGGLTFLNYTGKDFRVPGGTLIQVSIDGYTSTGLCNYTVTGQREIY